jgi:hypothetical protein
VTLTEFLAARYAEAWRAERDRELAAGLVTSRATRDVSAKREILLIHGVGHSCPAWRHDDVDPDVWFGDGLCDTARHLGSVFSDHPDYDPAWAPERG